MNRQKGPAVAKSLPFNPVLLRPLPRSVTPFPNETLDSYRHRLAAANQLPHFRAVRTPSRWLLCQLDELERLELLSGLPRRTLLWAIPELRHYDPDVAPQPSDPYRGFIRRACDLCSWRSGSSGEPVYVHIRGFHDNVCIRHRRWLACGKEEPGRQIDLEHAPEVVRAQIALNRLELKYKGQLLGLCYQLCERFWSEIDHRALVRKDSESTFERIYRPDPDQLPNRFGPVQRFRRAAAYPRIALLTQLVIALSLQSENERKAAHIAGDTYATFEDSFHLDYTPRTTTGPWIRGKFSSLVEATAKYVTPSD
ncbi:hypothetical protein ACSCB1_43830 [Streptomyces europaeiscabiei]|uniref:hypothetical protein n=1 Tax=Streptomyces europaeiscabiei TaxID=146819 RepID=UPI00069C766C|nr:hypothetical protein [Streptomyces europaeiscabiei]